MKFVVSIILFALVLEFFYITLQNSHLEDGTKLQALQNKISSLKKDNLKLKDEIAFYSAYTTISKIARSNGFIPMSEVIYITRQPH